MKTWKFIVAPTMFPTEMTFNYKAAMKPANTNIAKGTADPRIEFISQVPTQILIKFQFQTLD